MLTNSRAVLFLLSLTLQITASIYLNRPLAIFSENMAYLAELHPDRIVGGEGRGTAFKMNGAIKGDSLWSFNWWSREEPCLANGYILAINIFRNDLTTTRTETWIPYH